MMHRNLRGLLAAVLLAIFTTPAHAAVAPLVAGPGSGDSVWVTVSVNDTLGNAADADTLNVLWLHEGEVFDSVLVLASGIRPGQYVVSHVASDNGALGAYQVLVRASVTNRRPIANYAYTVATVDPCIGDGPVACTLLVFSAGGADTVAVPHAALRVTNSEETTTLALAETDLNGRAIVYLPINTVHVAGAHISYTIPPDTMAVDFDGVTDTLWGIAFDPGTSASPALCRVYGWAFDLSGKAIGKATVEARIPEAPLQYISAAISPYNIATETDTAGYWFLDLIPSTEMMPDTTRYDFTIRYPTGAILRRQIAVPKQTQWQLSW